MPKKKNNREKCQRRRTMERNTGNQQYFTEDPWRRIENQEEGSGASMAKEERIGREKKERERGRKKSNENKKKKKRKPDAFN